MKNSENENSFPFHNRIHLKDEYTWSRFAVYFHILHFTWMLERIFRFVESNWMPHINYNDYYNNIQYIEPYAYADLPNRKDKSHCIMIWCNFVHI